VLSDLRRLPLEWRRLLGEFLSAELGGPAQAWADANVPAFELWLRMLDRAMAAGQPVSEFVAPADRAWMEGLCHAAGRPVPERPHEWALRAYGYVSRRVDAAIPGAVEAARRLAALGIEMHMASSNYSYDLEGYLQKMGIRELIGRTYGVDLINTWKNGPAFYRAILAAIDRSAAETGVVDDMAEPKSWAEAVGMRAFGSLPEALAALS
jgi:phosphoglycolate phosphatase-like HAD superfamily hydrolase